MLQTGGTVLIVEDDVGVARLQQTRLERAGHRVIVVNRAEDVARCVAERTIDLILLDYGLPGGVSGLEVHNELRAAGRDVPVIMVTGRSDEATTIQALRQGIRDFVIKSADYLDYLPIATARVLEQERQLAESEARFRSVTESASDGILAIDGEGNIVSWNGGATRIFGYSANEAVGQPTAMLWASHCRDPRSRKYGLSEETINNSLLGASIELEGRRCDGTHFPIEVSFGTWTVGKEQFYSCIIRDVSERKRVEEALRDRDEQLRQSQKMEAVGNLAGGVAHEFNNLLQVIQAYTEFAMDGLSSDDTRYQDLEQTLRAADRAAALTHQLLGFGRRQAMEFKQVHANQLIRDLTSMIKPLIGENISIDVLLDEPIACIHADADQFQQLLMNLCINARDAMPEGGRIGIRTNEVVFGPDDRDCDADITPGRYLRLIVTDNGSGMSSEVCEHIFEPFYTTKDVGHGTGLGLAMVYGVIQQHRGAIKVTSTLGIGTSFTIYLPITDVGQEQTTFDEDLSYSGGKETILIAEDESLICDLYQRILGTAGYRLLIARDGEEALDLFRVHSQEVDLLLLDVIMPNLSGRELQRRLQQVRPDVPTVFCSGYDPETSQIGFVKQSGCPILLKPFNSQVLLRTVRHALDRTGAVLN